MVNLLTDLLSPIFSPMGVSAADLQSYLTMCLGYVYAILIALVVMIVVLIAAHKLRKGVKGLVRWNAVLAMVLVIALCANLICFGPLYTNLSLILNNSAELSEETIAQSKAVVQEVGEEGMVLLKNDGLLPLTDADSLNVFGWDSVYPIFGGTGSGSSDTSSNVGVIQSLQDAGFSTNQTLTDMYSAYKDGRGSGDSSLSISSTDWSLPEPTLDYYTDEIMSEATAFSDVAVICLGRSGGEGADEPTDMYAVIHGTYDIRNDVSVAPDNYNYYNSTYTNNGDYDDFDPGEHYLQLSNTEEDMIDLVCSTFDKVIVVVNANNTMELGWVDEYDSIGAVIWAPGTGATGMAALGEILSGAVNPSGKTVDTFVYDLTDTPYYNNIGNFSYTNVDDIKEANAAADAASEGNLAFVNYVEGIYVGYKFYETAAEEGFITFEDKVQYPFGYGLSYTTFQQTMENFVDNGDTISVDVQVTNTGSVAGKDVVELYFTPPYTNGGIEKSSVNLIDYAKTDLLEPGASQTISFTVAKEDMASYDSGEIKVAGGGYILEAGEYILSIRSDSHTVLDQVSFQVGADIDYSQTGRLSDNTAAVNLFDYAEGDVTYLSRADGFANYAQVTAAPSEEAYVMSEETRQAVMASAYATYDPALYDNADDVMPTTGADNGLTLADLTGKAYDDPLWEDLLDQLTVDDMTLLVNLGGWQTAEIASVGKVATNDCDGPAGVNNFITGNTGTSFPAEVLMAQTWSKEMAAKIGDAMGQEYEDLENWGWYGPAMDGHRSAFSGRNFEYYSEDGVLAGYFAAAQVNAAAEHGVYAYIKHFALNDQETNRCAFLLTYSNEQAMREIYLKPFELCVKNYTGTGLAVMSAFNWIGTVPAGASYELLTTVLRDEWGFQGMVESDYDGSYGYMISDHYIRSGNDLMLGFNYQATNLFTDSDAATCVLALRQASKNILFTTGNSGAYTHATEESGMKPMTAMFLAIDIGVVVVLAAIEVVLVLNYRKKYRAAKMTLESETQEQPKD